MLRFVGPNSTFCDHVSRRDVLRVGALGPLGIGLPGLLAAEAHGRSSAAPGFGKAKRCLLLFMWGGPAHQDLWDLKPNAPASVRGEFRPVATNVPGINICEHLPNLAGQMEKIALIRSLTHTDNNHSTGAHWMLTGHKHRLSAENFGASPSDFPHLGSVITKLLPSAANLPSFVALPERIATTIGAVVPGQNAGLLGSRYDPFTILEHPDKPNFKIDMLALRDGMDAARVTSRKNLLEAFNTARAELETSRRVHAMQAYYQTAADLVSSSRTRDAFDLAQESDRERDRYGRQTFGQSLLLARRLLEAGVRLVTVYWHRDMPGVDTTWDTHGQNFKQLKERLIPQIDRPIATLLADLRDRGLLDETLVVWSSEFGRTPKVNGNAGRDHWGACNSIWLAGGGVHGGQVHGASDKEAAYPADDPVGPADVTATIFHLLGIDPHTIVHDREDRPHTISHGQPLDAILSGRASPKDPLPAAPVVVQEPPAKPNAEILADKPRGYWPFQETAGRECRDLAGATPGEYVGDVAAGDQRMQATLAEWPDERYSVEFCFRNTRSFEDAAITAYLFSRAGAGQLGDHIGLGGTHRVDGDMRGRLFLFIGHASRGCVIGRTVTQVGHWYHVVFVRDGETVTLYLNGQCDTPELHGPLARTYSTRRLFAAVRSDGMFQLQGRLRDVALFDGVLPVERIAAHWRASGIK